MALPLDSILVGNRPIDVALSPDGTKLYVANQTDQNVAVVVDLASDGRLRRG